MKSLEQYHVYDLLNETETVVDVDQEQVHDVWPQGYFEFTDTLYDRKILRIPPSSLKKNNNNVDLAIKEMFASETAQYRAYIEAGTQLMPYKDKIRGQHVLDIGCGNGDLSFFLEQLSPASVTGADVHEENIDVCNKIKDKFNSDINFVVKDINDLTVDYLQQFDTVCAFQCLSWTNCHSEFFKNVNRAGVKNLLLTEQLKGLPLIECVNDRSYNVREPMLVHYFDQGYHYGGTGWQENKMCLRVETNLPFWVQVLDYYGWYIKDWSWQKNCTVNQKKSISTYRRRFFFHCINTRSN
jgi:2-polyprenyl-3-methyl-5-hydroxy-6-metoxy-1,4-benzoquinol methylase